ncbi:MAG: hypothetical protein NTZ63_06455 [Candidatus Omnitrophica bacterium]|nr:hypothetical protein [Candidatus Omnitrophota bacterium]
MINKLSEKCARINSIIIGSFYIISGIWEILLIMEGDRLAEYYLAGIRSGYLSLLGPLTIIIGTGLLFRSNTFRRLALVLAYWNLFTVPIIDIWWLIYRVYIKKTSAIYSLSNLCLWSVGILAVITLIRLYVIYMLGASKTGHIYLERYKIKP